MLDIYLFIQSINLIAVDLTLRYNIFFSASYFVKVAKFIENHVSERLTNFKNFEYIRSHL